MDARGQVKGGVPQAGEVGIIVSATDFDVRPFGGGQGPNCGSAWIGGEQVKSLGEDVGFLRVRVRVRVAVIRPSIS